MKKNKDYSMIRSVSILTFLIVCPIFLLAQMGRLNYANKLFNNYDYTEAVEAYLDVLQRNKDSLQVAQRIAICYDKMEKVQLSANWYEYLEKKGQLSKDGLFRLAYLERMSGDYDASNRYLTKYEQKYGKTSAIDDLFINQTALHQLQKENKEFEIKDTFLNTDASEIGASFFNQNKILITSSQRQKWSINRIYGWTGGHYYNLYQLNIGEKGEKSGDINLLKGEINTKYHDGMGSYDPVNNYLYFTRDNYLKGEGKGFNSDKAMLLKIYRAKVTIKKDKMIVGKAESLPFNNDSYSCSHPSISSDGQRLFFTSDMPGGMGQADIYYVNIDTNGTIGKPVNLGNTINTPYNDEFPYYKQNENLLFFASDGHKGLGGLDIFVAELDSACNVNSIQNLQQPINSRWDDFSFVNDSTSSFGYISSNRAGTDDIYRFIQHKPKLVQGNVSDYLTSNNIENALIILKDSLGNVIDSIKTDKAGNYKIKLPPVATKYTLTASANGYFPETLPLTTLEDKSNYKVDFKLKQSNYRLLATVKDDHDFTPIDSVSAIVKNRDGTILFQGLSDSLGSFIAKLGRLNIDDSLHLDIQLKKDGYITKTVPFDVKIGAEHDIKIDLQMTKIILGKTDLADVVNLDPVYFDLNSSFFNRSDAQNDMRKVVKILKENPTMKIAIKGNCDQRGSYKYNVWLSERRAQRAFQYIVAHGVSPSRIVSVKGYSYDKPKASQAQIDAAPSQEEKERLYQLNRRTEFIIVSMNS